MKTNRYNIYNLIHKALRALMYDTALTIQDCGAMSVLGALVSPTAPLNGFLANNFYKIKQIVLGYLSPQATKIKWVQTEFLKA